MVAVTRTPLHLVGDEDSSKRRQILDGARKVFMDLGFDGASMGEIARSAGVSKGTLYVYFADKNRLFEAIVEEEALEQGKVAFNFDPERDVDDHAAGIRPGLYPGAVPARRRIGDPHRDGDCRADAGSRPPLLRQRAGAHRSTGLAAYLEAHVRPAILRSTTANWRRRSSCRCARRRCFCRSSSRPRRAPSAERIARVVESATRMFLRRIGRSRSRSLLPLLIALEPARPLPSPVRPIPRKPSPRARQVVTAPSSYSLICLTGADAYTASLTFAATCALAVRNTITRLAFILAALHRALGSREIVDVKDRGAVDLKPFNCQDISRSSVIDGSVRHRKPRMLVQHHAVYQHIAICHRTPLNAFQRPSIAVLKANIEGAEGSAPYGCRTAASAAGSVTSDSPLPHDTISARSRFRHLTLRLFCQNRQMSPATRILDAAMQVFRRRFPALVDRAGGGGGRADPAGAVPSIRIQASAVPRRDRTCMKRARCRDCEPAPPEKAGGGLADILIAVLTARQNSSPLRSRARPMSRRYFPSICCRRATSTRNMRQVMPRRPRRPSSGFAANKLILLGAASARPSWRAASKWR